MKHFKEREFLVKGKVWIKIQNLKDGNEITKTMPSGEIVMGDVKIPFILQKVAKGSVNDICYVPSPPGPISKFEEAVFVEVSRHFLKKTTPFTKQGYVSLQIKTDKATMFFYIEKRCLFMLFGAFCHQATIPYGY